MVNIKCTIFLSAELMNLQNLFQGILRNKVLNKNLLKEFHRHSKFQIYAVNGVTDVAEEFGQMSKYAEANFRTESSSHYLSGKHHHLNTLKIHLNDIFCHNVTATPLLKFAFLPFFPFRSRNCRLC